MKIDDEIERFSGARRALLSTINPDGTPHLVPIVFSRIGDELVSAIDWKPKSTRALQRLENIRADPAVSLIVDNYDDDWEQAVVGSSQRIGQNHRSRHRRRHCSNRFLGIEVRAVLLCQTRRSRHRGRQTHLAVLEGIVGFVGPPRSERMTHMVAPGERMSVSVTSG